MSRIPLSGKLILFLTAVAVLTAIMSGCTNANSVAVNREALLREGESLASESSGIPPANGKPIISVRSAMALVGFGQEVTLFAEALDPDGDPLQFFWTASEGTIIAQSSNQITWKAPDRAVTAEIACRVDDRKGGAATARTAVEVVGGRLYRLSLQVDRRSLYAGTMSDTQATAFLPLAQARVSLPALGLTGISGPTGQVELALDNGPLVASATEVVIQYLDWEARYQLALPARAGTLSDSVQFFPGFDGVTVAVARGDSFLTKRGGVEVQVVEQTAGEYKPMSEVTVQVGTGQQVAQGGLAFLTAELPGSEALLRVTKSGYHALSGYRVPVFIDGVTLVRARMVPQNATFRTEAIVSWTKPFNGQKAVPVTGPFEIGFGQPMEQATVFHDMEMVIQEPESRTTLVLAGTDIPNRFTVQWDGDTIVRLTPKTPLRPLRRYSFSVTRWNARARDGRLLRSYAGMFGTFTTDEDGDPRVVSTSPRNGDTGVSRSGPFTLRFDRSMDRATLKQDLRLEATDVQRGTTVAIDGPALETWFSVQWSANDTEVALVPRRPLRAQTPYLVKLIRSGLRSKSGRAIQFFSNLWGQFSTGDL